MKKYGVLGYPAKHSLSPKIFNFLKEKFSQKIGDDFSYEILEIEPDKFFKTVELFHKYDGLNITSPYKQKILEFCKEKSPEVEVLGAANVIVNLGEGFKAYNTDVSGFVQSLGHLKVKEKVAVVFGSSGAAKAAVLGLQKIGVNDIYIKARDYSSFKQFGVSTREYTDQKPQVVVQATTIGLNKSLSSTNKEDLEFFEIDYSKAEVCYDLIYSPLVTPFMEIAQKNTIKAGGASAILNGKDMLILQALETFEIWTNQIVDKKDKKSLLAEIKERL